MIEYFGIGADIVKNLPDVYRSFKNWVTYRRPARKVLGPIANSNTVSTIYIKDFIVDNNLPIDPKLYSREGPMLQKHPHIDKVWSEVEGRASAELLNLLGNFGKRDKLEIVEMSNGYGSWDTNMIVLGAQAVKSMEFYEFMECVGYKVNEHDIYDNQNNEVVPREDGYGYGVIIKAKNPAMKNGIGILIGGFGVLGTEAAAYYFISNIAELGREFDKDYFSIIVRAKVSAGKQSATRIRGYDKSFKNS